MSADTRTERPAAEPVASPPVKRLRRTRWADPRLLVGLLIVAASVVAGARLFMAADDTRAVWAVRGDHRGGTPVAADDLRTVEIRFDDDAGNYVPASETIESGQVWAHDVRAGELLAAAALRPAEVEAVGELPVIVAPGALPSDLGEGDRVDVWVSDTSGGSGAGPARLVLERMRVLSVAGAAAPMGDTGGYRVLLGLEQDRPDRLGEALGAISSGEVTLVRRVGEGAP